jgi:hypothetical protein
LDEQIRQDTEHESTTHELRLLMGCLDDFASKAGTGLADADWHLRRDIIRRLVKELVATLQQVTVVFRIGAPPPPDPQTILCDIVQLSMLHPLRKSTCTVPGLLSYAFMRDSLD